MSIAEIHIETASACTVCGDSIFTCSWCDGARCCACVPCLCCLGDTGQR